MGQLLGMKIWRIYPSKNYTTINSYVGSISITMISREKKTQLRKHAVPSIRLTAKPLADDILAGFPLHIHAATLSSNEPSTSTQGLFVIMLNIV